MELAIRRALNEVNRPSGSGDMAVGAKVICKLKLWTAAILNLCKLTTFPVSKSLRLFICSSEGPNKQVKAKKPSIAICSRSSPTLTGLVCCKASLVRFKSLFVIGCIYLNKFLHF